MTDDDCLLTPACGSEDVDVALRPKNLGDFVGLKAARENLRVFIAAAKSLRKARRHGALDHGLRRVIFAA
jgi:Holliday junction DNA helicase RuvB